MTPPMTPSAEVMPVVRFMQKVSRQSGGCWAWTGAMNYNGYGRFYANGRQGYAHRFAYETFVKPIPSGMQIDHKCRVRCCVNPEHLEVVSQHENIMRGEGLAATNAGKQFCKFGHEFTPENTAPVTKSRPGRRCITCRKRERREQTVRDAVKKAAL